jgi:hypothetical protein
MKSIVDLLLPPEERRCVVLRLMQTDHECYLQALLPLALDGTLVGKTKAAQALAKIAITTNPENAFPGQRVR